MGRLNKIQTSRRLGIDYKTVLKYWDMTPDDYSDTRIAADCRTKKADRYKDFVLDCLHKYPDMSAAQFMAGLKKELGWKRLSFSNELFVVM